MGVSHLAVDQNAGLPLVLAVAAADAHETAGALPAAEAPPRHLGALALQRRLHLSGIDDLSHQIFFPIISSLLYNLIGQLFAPCTGATRCLRALSAVSWPLHSALVRAAAA